MTTVRILLAIASTRQWDVQQLDVNNAFLHGELEEEVYMDLPQGFYAEARGQGLVCKLKKSIYGLKQASRQWFAKLSQALITFGYKASQNDHSLFTLHSNGDFLLLLVYVDDIVITGTSKDLMQKTKKYLHQQFKIKDLGTLRYFLGLEVARSESGIFINQRKYALDILKDSGYIGCKPCKNPIDSKHKLAVSEAPKIQDPEIYRRLVGRLIYLTISRPDLAYSVHVLSQFMAAPTEDHMQAAHRVLRYIKGAPGKGLYFPSSSSTEMRVYCDADWAACPATRRSITGYCIFVGSSLVSWKTKKQSTVSRSSAESEYRSMASTCCEVVWIHRLLSDMNVAAVLPIRLYCDNKSALHIAQNPVFHERTKHIELDCHLVREHIQNKFIEPRYVSSENQLADMFTKPLTGTQLESASSKLGLSNFLYSPLVGGCWRRRNWVLEKKASGVGEASGVGDVGEGIGCWRRRDPDPGR